MLLLYVCVSEQRSEREQQKAAGFKGDEGWVFLMASQAFNLAVLLVRRDRWHGRHRTPETAAAQTRWRRERG